MRKTGGMAQEIVSIRVFGSVARGDNDYRSDLDILAILADNQKPSEEPVNDFVLKLFGEKGSISWYSYRRIRELFQEGHLFAWHIFLESKQIAPANKTDVVNQLGEPSKYTSAYRDMASLLGILSSVKRAIIECPRNVVYEAGLIYVCTKNIALIASSFGDRRLDFSRYSPYNLNIEFVEFPLARKDYDLLIQARHSSMRGLSLPQLYKDDVTNLQMHALKWGRKIQAYFRRGGA